MKKIHRMLRMFFILVFSFAFFAVHAQTQTQTPKYTVHTVVKGESLSVLASRYHTTVGDIMRLNGMNANSQLKVGQKIKIPSATTTSTKTTVTKTTPTKTTKKVSADTEIINHYVLQGETLYSISKKFGATVDDLKQWNHLPDDNIHFGQKLIVKGGTAQVLTAPNVAQQQPDSTQIVKEEPSNNNSGQEETKPVAETTSQTDASKANETAEANNNNNGSNAIVFNTASATETNAGYFEKNFMKPTDAKSITGSARTFQSPSGWGDKKYYLLANGITSGSIVKVSANGKSIYAKVLWSLDAKGNDGLSFRLSDAAAFALGVNDPSFNLTVEY